MLVFTELPAGAVKGIAADSRRITKERVDLMKKSLLGITLALGFASSLLIAQPVQAIDAFDKHDPSSDEFLDQRTIEVGQGNGEIDMLTLPEVGPPMKLELNLKNSSDSPVNVRIPKLGVSFVVPAQETRTHYMSMLSVGRVGKVDFTTETLTNAPTVSSTTTTTTTTESTTVNP